MRRNFGESIRAGVRRAFVLALGHDRSVAENLRIELEAHVESRVEYLVARGVPAGDARAEAIRRFGGDMDQALEQLQVTAMTRQKAVSRREQLSSIAQDARFVLRGLRRSPAFTIGVIATFGLGLGINSAVFRVADRVLVRAPAVVTDPWRLRRIATVYAPSRTSETEGITVSFPQAQLIAESHAFERFGLYIYARNLRAADSTEVAGVYVDSGFFSTLGVGAAAGRLFDQAESAPGAGIAVAVVSYDYWQNHFGGSSINGKTLALSDRTYQVIGVTPRNFAGVDLDPVDIWLPMGVASLGQGTINGVDIPWYRMNMFRGVRAIGRVGANANDASIAARASVSLLAPESQVAAGLKALKLRSISASSESVGDEKPGIMLGRLVGVTLVVLLIACANAANLLLARGLRRRREIGLRLALGASRARVVRLLIVESIILGLLGGIAAIVTGYWTSDALRRLIFPDARWTTAALDERALAFTLSAALIAGLAAGLAPAFQLTSPDLVNALKDNRHQPGQRSHTTRAALVITQTAFSLSLLIVSGLLVRSLQHLNEVNVGFTPDGLVTSEMFAARRRGDPSSTASLDVADFGNKLRRYPMVKAVALASNAPFGSHSSMTVSVPGEPDADVSSRDGPWYSVVSANFFSVMGTHVISGRAFTDGDVVGSQPVAIVNATMAKLFWQDGNPYRSCLLARNTCAKVVGIVDDIRDTRGGGPPPPRYYLPLAQQEDHPTTVVVRTTSEQSTSIASVLKTALPSDVRSTIAIISDRVEKAMRPWRVATMLFGALGGVALLLACVGVYSVVSYIASERTHELGVRIALGASSRDIVQLVLTSGLRLVGIGAVVGLVAAALGSRFLSTLLFGVSPVDPVVYTGCVAALAVVGVVAALLPAVRVMHTDPTIALRAE